MKRTAVIILNWNGLELLKKFLPAAVRDCLSSDSDLIVADNGSVDGSAEWVESTYPNIKVIRFEKNLGFAEGYNRAIKQTGYEYSVLLNSDVETTEGWLLPLVRFMDNYPEVAAVQPKILSWHNKEMFEYAGAAGGFIDNLGYPYCRGRIFGYIEKDNGQYDGEAIDVAWASGAALIVRTSDYLQVGGLDPLFFAHMEEIDLCVRFRAAGKRVCVLTDSKVYHVGGASLSSKDSKKVYLNFRNNLLLLYKNLPRKKGSKKLIARRLADTLAFGMYIVKGQFGNAQAIVKAHIDFKKMKKHYTKFPENDIWGELPGTHRSIVTDYYLKGKRK